MICGNKNSHCDHWKGDATICQSRQYIDILGTKTVEMVMVVFHGLK